MIANENQYRVTQERERRFTLLVSRLENGSAQSRAGESPAIRRGKLESAQSVLQDLRQELQEWEALHYPGAPRNDIPDSFRLSPESSPGPSAVISPPTVIPAPAGIHTR